MRFPRRRFLAAGLSVPAWVVAHGASSARAQDDPAAQPAAASERISCGLIGCGGRGTYLSGLAVASGQAHFAALCDVNEPRISRCAQAIEAAQGTPARLESDYRRLLDDPQITALFIATPHHWHALIALEAIRAGKHIYLEKPASHVFREGRVLADASAQSGRVFQHGSQMRSSPVTSAAREVLASGVLGPIKLAKAWGVEPRRSRMVGIPDAPVPDGLDWDRWLGPAPLRAFNPERFSQWNDCRDYGNGEIGGDGIHDIDMARWGLGVERHPDQITAQGSRVHVQSDSDFPDNMLVTYQYDPDKVLIYENRNFAPYPMHGWDNGNLFCGTEGYMVFSRRGYFQTYLGANEEKGPGMEGTAGNEEHIQNFLRSVREGSPSIADAGTAHLSCALVHLGEIAYRTGRVIRFDPSSEMIRDDPEAAAMLTKSYRDPYHFA